MMTTPGRRRLGQSETAGAGLGTVSLLSSSRAVTLSRGRAVTPPQLHPSLSTPQEVACPFFSLSKSSCNSPSASARNFLLPPSSSTTTSVLAVAHTMSRTQQDQFIDDDEEETCPLCVEEFDLSDRGFRPCVCGYQVCYALTWKHLACAVQLTSSYRSASSATTMFATT